MLTYQNEEARMAGKLRAYCSVLGLQTRKNGIHWDTGNTDIGLKGQKTGMHLENMAWLKA